MATRMRHAQGSVAVDCPVCRTERVEVRLELQDGRPVAAEVWSECECGESDLVDQSRYTVELEQAAGEQWKADDEDLWWESRYARSERV